jgi:ABC-type antimicrobial peptide transport system permease subunit
MGAVWLLSSSDVRRRGRNLIAITLLVAVVGAIVMATAAGARRSSTALDRFNAYSRTSTLEITVGQTQRSKIAEFARTPGIEALAVLQGFAVSMNFNNSQATAAAFDAALGTIVDRPRLLKGRLADLDNPDEVTIGEGLAARIHVGIGDHIEGQSLTPKQVADLTKNIAPKGLFGPKLRWTIVGITRRPLDLGDLGASGGVIVFTPAFERRYEATIGRFGLLLRVRTHSDAATINRVTQAGSAMFGSSSAYSAKNLDVESHGARDAINVITLALWIFAGVAAIAGAVAIAIVLSREVASTTPAQGTLRALGLRPVQRILVSAPGAALVALAGTLLAVIGAVLFSPFLPVGIARRSDPNPGLHADWFVLGLGALGVIVLVTSVTLVAALRSARAGDLGDVVETRHRRPTVAESAARVGCSPALVNGLRMALQPGRGERAVPVRSAFLATALGVLGITSVLVFSASLNHTVATPRVYGWTFDFKAIDSLATGCDAKDEGIGKVAGVGDLAGVCVQALQAEGRAVTAWSFTPIRGAIGPAIVSGRGPVTEDEVALGKATMSGLHKRVGDTVQIAFGPTTRVLHIVGVGAFPRLVTGDVEPVADGAYMTAATFKPFLSGNDVSRYIVGRYLPGARRASVDANINKLSSLHGFGEQTFFGDTTVSQSIVPPEIDRLRHIGWFPPALIALLAVLATIAVGHALITSVRRRRTDLALMKTLGFQHRQLRATVAYEASTIVLVGCAVGIPAGMVVGRFAWRATANGLGIAPAVVYPALLFAASALIGLAIVNLLGSFPANRAARTPVAPTLRSE